MPTGECRLLTIAVVPDPIRYARNLYLHFLYGGIAANITDARAVANIGRSKPDLLHIHFPDHVLSVSPGIRMVWRAFMLFAPLLIARLRRIPVVWTVHNLRPHRPQPTWRCERFYRILGKFVDGLVFHSEAMRRECEHRYAFLSDRKTSIVRHPCYPSFATGERPAAIAELCAGHERYLACMLGSLRDNKNIIPVLRDFIQRNDPQWALVIAGERLELPVDRAIRHLICGHGNVGYFPRFLSESEFDDMLAVADVVAIPYGALHTSGVAVRALSLRRKVLALSTPEMREIQALAPSMVRLVDSLDCFWSALPRGRELAWDGRCAAGLPGEFGPASCQERLLLFYRSFLADARRTGQ